MRAAALVLLTLITGCVGQMADQMADQMTDQMTDVIIFGPDRALTVALYSYREGAGHWPESPDVLAKSPFLAFAMHLDRYKNLKFEALDDGRLAVSFDRYASPDGKIVWTKSRFDVGGPVAH
jgi:hypothetical protein